jgi:TolB-like protein/Tfp pilus assembly protein PilF
MTPDSKDNLRLEIGHVLFIDIVGYSKLMINEQSEQIQTLKEIVRGTEQVRLAEAEHKLLRLPTGDGGALVFRNNLEAPVLCALEVAKALKSHPGSKEKPQLRLRMGIHSGPVNEVTDLNEQANIAGAGINIAQRVMDCGDTGHILLSKHVADDLEHYPRWRPNLHNLGDVEVKHGVRVGLVNFYDGDTGNPQIPKKLYGQRRKRAGARFAFAAAAVLTLTAIAAGAWFLQRKQTRSTSNWSDKSLAVLPFNNLSDDKSNAYFAEGIQDEILSRLSKVADLKVISRTSTQRYKAAPNNLREVGAQLGVANLLEGSVQKVSNAVHVTVQLIRAADDKQLWAESYSRKLDDIFAVEGEVAGAIADQLNAKLTGSDKQQLAAKPTQNPAAYDAYLRGLAFEGRVDDLRTSWLKTAESFAEAVRADPKFALAWAHLARAESLVFRAADPTPQHRDAARNAVQKAEQLAPDLIETKTAKGWYLNWVEHDYAGASAQFEEVHRAYPNSGAVTYALANITRRLGRWDQSRSFFEQALELDPQNVVTLTDAALNGLETRDPVWSQGILRRALDLSPQNPSLVAELASTYQSTGDIKQAQTVLQTAQPKEGDFFYVNIFVYNAILLRNYQPAIELLTAQLQKGGEGGASSVTYEIYLGDLRRHAGERSASMESYQKAKEAAEQILKTEPDNPDMLAIGAWAQTWLGDKTGALQHAQRAVALVPVSQDARGAPGYEESLARIQAVLGDKESAITALEKLLITPYGYPNVTVALLRIDPDWDNLRDDPRFQKLCQEKAL